MHEKLDLEIQLKEKENYIYKRESIGWENHSIRSLHIIKYPFYTLKDVPKLLRPQVPSPKK